MPFGFLSEERSASPEASAAGKVIVIFKLLDDLRQKRIAHSARAPARLPGTATSAPCIIGGSILVRIQKSWPRRIS